MAPDRRPRSVDGFSRPRGTAAASPSLPRPVVLNPPSATTRQPAMDLATNPQKSPNSEPKSQAKLADSGATPNLPNPSQISDNQPGLAKVHSRKSRKLRVFMIILSTIVLVAVMIFGGLYSWYQSQLSPVTADTTKHVRLTIKPGMTPAEIANLLEKSSVIRSSLAFTIYTKLSGTENNLKAGAYDLHPSRSTPAIVDHLVEGKSDTFRVTFLPGDTVANGKKVLLSLDFTQAQIDSAFSKDYTSPLFDGKPAGMGLEGYLYGETIEFRSDSSVSDVLQRFFDEFEKFVIDNNLVSAFKKQGLNLYQGITLASIVQRETAGDGSGQATNDQRQVARVFLNRMKAGMNLGSDVTYQYAAKIMGVQPDPKLDSPYNTRIHAGLPPGPIATPGNSSLLAVANPGKNNYLFFLSGDDEKMHYATTDEQHQQNVADFCHTKCSIP